MIQGSASRRANYPIHPLFLDRWSPRAMSGEPIAEPELMVLFEAARWAPSASNHQPWRLLYARRDTESWPLFFDLLAEGNKVWCKNAAALVLFISKITNDRTGKPLISHSFDTGAAWENLALQGTLSRLVVHGMAGFDYDRARTVLRIPDDFQVEAMVAVGRPGPIESLPEDLQKRESPNDRRGLEGTICEGPFSFGP